MVALVFNERSEVHTLRAPLCEDRNLHDYIAACVRTFLAIRTNISLVVHQKVGVTSISDLYI